MSESKSTLEKMVANLIIQIGNDMDISDYSTPYMEREV